LKPFFSFFWRYLKIQLYCSTVDNEGNETMNAKPISELKGTLEISKGNIWTKEGWRDGRVEKAA
jgi:hypothetical protein